MIQIDRNSLDGMMISWLRLPLAVLVVAAHTYYSQNPEDLSYVLGHEVLPELYHLAVPCFFFLSGYLLFARYNRFGIKEYCGVLKRKFLALAVPYMIWNGLMFYGRMISGTLDPYYEPWDFYRVFWVYYGGGYSTSMLGYDYADWSEPINVPLWFLRDLMVVTLLSPLIWRIVKCMGKWSLLLFILPYIFLMGVPIHGFGTLALCFFPMGAAFSILGMSLSEFIKKSWRLFVPLYLLVITLRSLSIINDEWDVLFRISLLTGVFFMLSISYWGVRHTKSRDLIIKLGEASFLIYVGHEFLFVRSVHELSLYLREIPIWGGMAGCVISIFGRVAFLVLSYFLLKAKFPGLLKVLTGWRKNVKPTCSADWKIVNMRTV